ncbi:MAG: hypothetical protein CME65_02805 [Halobacteriovoraceae bacterium]|nr:hypothetical protein [Halobacteriovoraceae bacterium]|tara:strand:- start:911 stop:1831 length:921 start_codon:yes stop_codon:yes gene_type:complete
MLNLKREKLRWFLHHLFRKTDFRPSKSTLKALEEVGYKRKIRPIETAQGFDVDKLKECIKAHRPLLLKGAANDWACMRWSPENLSQRYPDETGVITDGDFMDEKSFEKSLRNLKKSKIGEFSRVSHIVQNNKGLQTEMGDEKLKKVMSFPHLLTSYQFFFGQIGNTTKLHAGATNNLQIQVEGTKIWHLIEPRLGPILRPVIAGEPLLRSWHDTSKPDFEKYPEQKVIPIIEASHEKGDILFIPTFWWHQVMYQNSVISAGVRWISPYSIFRSSLTMLFIVLTAYNPSCFKSLYQIIKGKNAPFFK